MHKVMYKVRKTEEEAEREWLLDQKIYASFLDTYDYQKDQFMLLIGCIVSEEVIVSLKLRGRADLLITPYKK